MPRPPPSTPLFPYTTLFRSIGDVRSGSVKRVAAAVGEGAQVVAALHAFLAATERTAMPAVSRSEEHTSELQSRFDLVCRLLLEKKKQTTHARVVQPSGHQRL